MLLCQSGLCKKTNQNLAHKYRWRSPQCCCWSHSSICIFLYGQPSHCRQSQWRWRVLFFQCQTDRGYKQAVPGELDLTSTRESESGVERHLHTVPLGPHDWSQHWLWQPRVHGWSQHEHVFEFLITTHVYCSFRFGFLNHCRHFIHFAVWYNYTFN